MLLQRIAEEAEIDHPATLFLGRDFLQRAVELAGTRTSLDRRHEATLCMLRRRLYG